MLESKSSYTSLADSRVLRQGLVAPPSDDRSWIHHCSFGPHIAYLPKGADTAPAFSRCRADSRTRAAIEAALSRCPEEWSVICAVCDKLSANRSAGRKDAALGIPKSVHAVACHMEAKYVCISLLVCMY